MATIGTIGEFDLSNPQSWDIYCEQLTYFMEANSITDEAKKRAVLLTVCGIRTLGVLRSLLAPDSPSTKSFDELIRTLKGHFAPASSEIYRRFKFHKRLQQGNESVTCYVTELRKLSEECNFGDTLSERLRDQLVCGLKDENLQRRLLAETSLSFNEALAKAVAAETAAEQAKQMHADKQGVSSSSAYFVKQRKSSQMPPANNYKKENTPITESTCHGCGGNHIRSQCKYKETVCRNCAKKGHLERVCRAKRNTGKSRQPKQNARFNSRMTTHALGRDHNNQTSVYEMNHVRKADTKYQKMSTVVVLNGQECIMEIDSGSDYSIISSCEFDRIWTRKKPQISSLPFQLCDYQKSPINIRGQCFVPIRYNKFRGKLRLLIAEGSRTNLLGFEWFKPLGIKLIGVHHTDISILDTVLQDFHEVFSEGLGSYKGPAISLPIDPSFPPITFKARNIPLAMKKKVDLEIDKLLEQGVLEPVSNPKWTTPVVPIVKSNGDIRLCADYKVTINKAMTDHPYPIPSINHLLANLKGGVFFAKIDLAQAYLQLKVDERSAEAQTIISHRGAFKVNRLQFGVKVAPGIFQNLIDELVGNLEGVIPYFDDILIKASSISELSERLRQVLSRLKEAGLRVNKNKCKFGVTEVQFLGYRVDAEGIHPSKDKVEAIQSAPVPKDRQQLQAFLGLLNFYNGFLNDKATVAEPLHRLLDKNSKWEWREEHDKAFSSVKNLLSSESVLIPFDEKLPIVLTCDASPYGIGYVLSHTLPDGREAPVAFASRTLTSAERNYSQLDKEALALIAGVKKFHYFLYGHTFTLVTDHQPLLGLFNRIKVTPEILSPRMLRWSQMLNAYDFKIVHRPGKKIQNADALSRLPVPTPDCDVPSPPEVLFLEELQNPPLTASEISRATLRDPILSRVLNWVWRGWPEQVDIEFRNFFIKKNELSVHKNCLLWGNRVVIPKVHHKKVLEELHIAHPGIERMKALARCYVWWPKIDDDIASHVGLCQPCQETRHAPPRAPVHPWEVTSVPWSRLHIDFAGPFQGHMFFILVDSFSKWVEVKRMSAATSEATIHILRELFATHGIPDSVVSDNGSQFTSHEFKNFLSRNGIRQILTAPYHPSSNGQAERVVQTTKDALKRTIKGNWNQRLSRFLLNQHITPSPSSGYSPAEVLMKRRLRTLLDLLHPDLAEDMRANRDDFQAKNANGRMRAYLPDDPIFVKNHSSGPAWVPGTVIEATGPVSYKAVTPEGKTVRCHLDQMRNRKLSFGDSPASPGGHETTSRTPEPVESHDVPATSTSPGTGIISTPRKQTPESNRPRRTIKLPVRLKDYIL